MLYDFFVPTFSYLIDSQLQLVRRFRRYLPVLRVLKWCDWFPVHVHKYVSRPGFRRFPSRLFQSVSIWIMWRVCIYFFGNGRRRRRHGDANMRSLLPIRRRRRRRYHADRPVNLFFPFYHIVCRGGRFLLMGNCFLYVIFVWAVSCQFTKNVIFLLLVYFDDDKFPCHVTSCCTCRLALNKYFVCR